jgi:hypothetical protein
VIQAFAGAQEEGSRECPPILSPGESYFKPHPHVWWVEVASNAFSLLGPLSNEKKKSLDFPWG